MNYGYPKKKMPNCETGSIKFLGEHIRSGRRQEVFDKICARIAVDPHTGCWVWQGPDSGDGRGGGYPRMCLDGQTVAVHRVIYTHFFGFIPGRKQIDHTCCNRMCVNPDHLEMVTHCENQRRKR